MKAKPYKLLKDGGQVPCEPSEATHIWLHFPGPLPNRCIPVMLKGRREGTKNWTWNGDTEKPTLRPSIKSIGARHLTDEEVEALGKGERVLADYDCSDVTCHSWVTDGKVIFLNDSTHELAGKTLDLLEVEL